MNPNSTPSKEEVFPDLSDKSVHLSMDEPQLHGIETKGIQWGSMSWCPHGRHSCSDWLMGPFLPGNYLSDFLGVAYKAVLLPLGHLIWLSRMPDLITWLPQCSVSSLSLWLWTWKRKHQIYVNSFGRPEI